MPDNRAPLPSPPKANDEPVKRPRGRPPKVKPPELPIEPIEGPTEPARRPAPAWMSAGNDKPQVTAPSEAEDNSPASDILVDTVAIVHDKAAEVTGYEGWRLTDREIGLWRKILRYLLRSLPVKDWPMIVCFCALAMSEGTKVFGYLKFRKEQEALNPVKAKDDH